MSSDDLTDKLSVDKNKITQPMIADLFKLVEQGQQALNMRLDGIDARLDEIESRLSREIEGVNILVANGFRDLSSKINVLNRSRLQTEADYENLIERIRELESKAS